MQTPPATQTSMFSPYLASIVRVDKALILCGMHTPWLVTYVSIFFKLFFE